MSIQRIKAIFLGDKNVEKNKLFQDFNMGNKNLDFDA